MGRHFLRGLLPLLPPLPPPPPPPPLRVWHCKLSLESVPPFKRPRSSLMAPPRIGTHNGTFHCDEALACALLRLLPEYRVRSAKADLGAAAFLPGSLLGSTGPSTPPTFPGSLGNPTLTPIHATSCNPLTYCNPGRMQRLCEPETRKNWLLATS